MRRHTHLGPALVLLLTSSARAADPPAPELLLFGDQVVSAAAKHPQPTRQAPSSVTVVTREDIRR